MPEAQAIINEAIKRPGTTPYEVYSYAYRHVSRGNKEAALFIAQKAKETFPKDVYYVPLCFARTYSLLGDKENGIKQWMTVIKNIPEDEKRLLPLYEGELNKLRGL